MSSYSREKVTFSSEGITCVGYLYLPHNMSEKIPCIILANGFSGTMDWNLPNFAERFSKAGFAAFIFDYRYFGESKGNPRQLINVKKQREDIVNAVTYIKQQKRIDSKRIVLWGTSLGGGHVITIAAADPSIAAVIAQVPGIDMVSPRAKAIIKIPALMIVKIMFAAIRDGIQGVLGMKPYYIKVFGTPNETAIFTDPKLGARFDALMHAQTTWENKFTPRFYLHLPRYTVRTAEKIKAPLLVCVGDKEIYANPKFQAWVGNQAPNGKVNHYQAEHFDFYHGALFEQVVQDQINFLRANL